MSAAGDVPTTGRTSSPAPGRTGRSTASGPGRVLVAVYGVFAVSATARASVQVMRDWHEAPLAYALSAVAAAVYVVATLALARGARPVALTAVVVELVGVLVVGAVSVADPEAFPQATVWSGFGSGYGYVPLLLPLLGLGWLWRSRRGPGARADGPGGGGRPGSAGGLDGRQGPGGSGRPGTAGAR